MDLDKTKNLISHLKGMADRYEADAAKSALVALQGERMTVNPPDWRRVREDAIALAGIAQGYRSAANDVGLHLIKP